MQQPDRISNSLAHFFSTCPLEFDFSLGGNAKIPLDSEIALAEAIGGSLPLTLNQLESLRCDLTRHDAYRTVIFAVRNSIFSARKNAAAQFDVGIVALSIDDGLVDWRDKMIVLSLMEDCANRLGLDFCSVVERHLGLVSAKDIPTIRDGYLARPVEMRSIRVMGFSSIDGKEGLSYVKAV